MTTTHSDPIRSSIADLVTGGLNSGELRYLTSADALIAAGALSATAAGAAVNGVSTFNAIGDATNSTGSTQTVAKFALTDSTANDDVFGSVTLVGSGGDIEITDTSVADGVPISTNNLTYTACP